MIPALNGAMLTVSGSAAASIVAKATLSMALALIGVWLTRKSRAAVRHALLTAAFGVLLTLPLISFVVPPIQIAVASTAERPSTRASSEIAAEAVPAPVRTGTVPYATPQSIRLSLTVLLLAGWIGGTLLSLLPVAIGLWQVRSLRRSAVPWQHGQAVAEDLALEAGIRTRAAVYLHDALPGPMTCGARRPAIILPQEARGWKEEDLNRAIVHELEHTRRGDWLIGGFVRVVCAAYWFHPLVWVAWPQLTLEAERSCDDAVLERSEATVYADQLLGLAKRLVAIRKSPFPAMANRADLATRVGAVLDSRQRRGRAGMFPVMLVSFLAIVLAFTISPLKMVAAPQASTASGKGGAVTRFVSNTGLVITTLSVSDENGRSIEGLSANDFTITEDGVPQRISIFEYHQTAGTFQDAERSSYYVVGFYARDKNTVGRFRRLSVTANLPRMPTLTYRTGYYPNFPVQSRPAEVSASADTTFPVPIYKPEPDYSDAARRAKWSGSIVLSADVDATGQATNIKVLRNLGLGLDEKAIEAVKEWRFKAGTRGGLPVAMPVEVEVNFRLL